MKDKIKEILLKEANDEILNLKRKLNEMQKEIEAVRIVSKVLKKVIEEQKKEIDELNRAYYDLKKHYERIISNNKKAQEDFVKELKQSIRLTSENHRITKKVSRELAQKIVDHLTKKYFSYLYIGNHMPEVAEEIATSEVHSGSNPVASGNHSPHSLAVKNSSNLLVEDAGSNPAVDTQTQEDLK